MRISYMHAPPRAAAGRALCVRMAVADVNVLEKMAVAASEAWDTTVTNFLDQELVAATEQRLEGSRMLALLKSN